MKNRSLKESQSGQYKAIVMGVSAGGLKALTQILSRLNPNYPLPILIVQHMSPSSDGFLAEHLNSLCPLVVKEAQDSEPILPGTVYLAPPNYHLLVEPDRTIALSTEGRINYSRPSIDPLFMSAAEAYMYHLIGVILTGANFDGTQGLIKIKQLGGLAVVQDPVSADAQAMPTSAIKHVAVDHVVPLNQMAECLNALVLPDEETRSILSAPASQRSQIDRS